MWEITNWVVLLLQTIEIWLADHTFLTNNLFANRTLKLDIGSLE